MAQNEALGLYDDVADRAARDRTVKRFRERGIRLPTFAQMADPAGAAGVVGSALDQVGADDADPRNLWRVHWYNDATRETRTEVPEYLEIPGELTGVDARILIALGNRFPMIPCPQGARRLLVSRAAGGGGALRPDPAPCRLAVDRQLRARRRRDQSPDGMPRGRGAARGHESRAIRLAGGVDLGSVRRHPHHRHRVERQGDLRRVQRAQQGHGERHPQPILRDGEPPRSLRSDRACARADLRARGGWIRPPRRLHLCIRLRRDARRRRLPQGASTPRASFRWKRSNARRCSTTATASTTSRGSATSTFR